MISDASAEIVFSGKAQPGVTATDVNVDEVTMKLFSRTYSIFLPIVFFSS